MGRDLPQRSTRGKRIQAALEEEDEADQQFWNQEFFAEEEHDDEYQEEAEPEDVVDSDFDKTEDEDDDEEGEEVEERPRKKGLKPPGAPRAKPKPSAEAAKAAAERKAAKAAAKAAAQEQQQQLDEDDDGTAAAIAAAAAEISYEAPTLRRSTKARSAEAEKARQQQQQQKARKPRGGVGSGAASTWKPLTQAELLAEAARTEVENLTSLKALLAQEEETKRRAVVVKNKHTGPTVKMRSRRGFENHELTTLELMHTNIPPPWLRRQSAPPPSRSATAPTTCVITGLPAKYVDRPKTIGAGADPHQRRPYANALAYKRLKAGMGPIPPQEQAMLRVSEAQGEAARRAALDGELRKGLGVAWGEVAARAAAAKAARAAAGGVPPPLPGDTLTSTRQERVMRRAARHSKRSANKELLAFPLPPASGPAIPPPAPPQNAFDLPVHMMALIADLHSSLQQQQQQQHASGFRG